MKKYIIIAVVIIILLIALYAPLRKALFKPDENKYMAKMAEITLQTARAAFDVDFTLEKEGVEKAENAVMGRLSEDYAAGRINKQALEGLVVQWGAFLGEAIKLKLGGKWKYEKNQFDEGRMALAVNYGKKTVSYNVEDWVFERITKGKDGDIYKKYLAALEYGNTLKFNPAPFPGNPAGKRKQ